MKDLDRGTDQESDSEKEKSKKSEEAEDKNDKNDKNDKDDEGKNNLKDEEHKEAVEIVAKLEARNVFCKNLVKNNFWSFSIGISHYRNKYFDGQIFEKKYSTCFKFSFL